VLEFRHQVLGDVNGKTPPGGLGSQRFVAEVWGKSVLSVADAAEFLHGQDPEPH
jgi:hypothetical protein